MIGAPVTVYTGGDAHKWRVSHIQQGIGASITITHEPSEMIVDKSWFMFDTSIGSLVLQRLGFFSHNTKGEYKEPLGPRPSGTAKTSYLL